MAFEVYVPRRKKNNSIKIKRPAIRLSKTSLVLNKWAREALKTDSIEIAFDPETNIIRIAPGDVLHIKKTKVFAKGFFKRFGISQKGEIPVEVKDGMLFADIKGN